MATLEELFARFAEHGDLEALGEVFDRTAEQLLRAAAHCASSEAAAEDLVQSTFAAAIENAQRWDQHRPLVPWLAGILAKKAKKAGWLARRKPAAQVERVAPHPAEHAERMELHASVLAALARVDELYREPLRLRLVEEHSPLDIARRLGRSPGAVRVQLHRGIEMLRRLLPPGLALGALTLLPARGLAAVRAAILEHAAASGVAGSTTSLTLGVLLMKKTFLLAAALAVALAWLAWPRKASEPSETASRPTTVAEAPASRALAPSTSRSAVAADAPESTPSLRPRPTDELWLRGRVLDARRVPITGARVTARTRVESTFFAMLDPGLPAEGLAFAAADTDGAGRFAFLVRRARPLDVVVVAPGHARTVRPECHGGQEIEFVLQAAATIIGRVVLARDKSPVAGARVRAFGLGGRADLGLTVTDEDGRYRLDDVAPDQRFCVEVLPRVGEIPNWAILEPRAGETIERDFTIADAEVTRGRVTDATTGQPIAGAEVGLGWTFRGSVRSDAGGRYEIQGHPRANGEAVHVRAAGYAKSERALAKNQLGRVLDFALLRGAVARGRALDPAGRPLAGVYVAAVSSEGAGQSQRTDWRAGMSASDGTFTCRDLRPDCAHALLLRSPGHATLVYDFPHELEPGETLDLGDLRMQPGGTLEGRVVGAHGDPIAGCFVNLLGTNSDRARFVEPPRPGARKALGAELPVIGSALGQFAGGDDPPGGTYVRNRTVGTGPDGRFALDDLASGTYELQIQAASGPQRKISGLAVAAGESLLLPDVVLDLGLRVRGVVVTSTGKPVSGAFVRANDGPGGRAGPRAMTDRDGAFLLQGLPAGGRVQLTVDNHGRAEPDGVVWGDTVASDVVAGDERVRIELAPAATITGRVVDKAGAPRAGARVVYFVRAPVPMPHVLSAVCDARGAFVLHVPAGAKGDVQLDLTADMAARMLGGRSIVSANGVAAGTADLVLVDG